MATQRAIVIQGPGVAKLVNDRLIPVLQDDSILVKTVTVGLNPTDWKHIDFFAPIEGLLVGCDYAGIVEAVGSKVTKDFQVGDRIAGGAHGSNIVRPEDGTFAEHIIVKGDLQIKIPDNVTFEQAATLGIGITTIGQSLYQNFNLPRVNELTKKHGTILIYGGSTATGTLAIQYAKLSGYTVLATSSPRNFELLKSLGADLIFDYNDPQVAQKIRKLTDNKLVLAFDTISTAESAQICADALTTGSGAAYHALLHVKFPRDDVKSTMSVYYTQFGRAFKFSDTRIPAKPEDFEFAAQFWDEARELLATGKLKPHPARVGDGLENVLEGLKDLKENRVSGEKLVYRV
ncbi:hypothetical protein QQS21_009720 [Conoideocrella luteorostrata]|uniref:Enoyl reductase (ER) domain-containing protein n=1 Tax=Conoideocrella luteorostrata TaxID=1105319 RepID=A0AAJ0FXJ2_9HYPO|nr:hypothetical protein QQS21_009720 [Conoideocrella luteorostrata]